MILLIDLIQLNWIPAGFYKINFSVFCSWGSYRSACAHAAIGELLFLLSWLENLEAAHKSIINGHHCSCIVKLSTVVRGTEQGHELPLGKELVAVLHHLVSPTNEVYVVLLVEC